MRFDSWKWNVYGSRDAIDLMCTQYTRKPSRIYVYIIISMALITIFYDKKSTYITIGRSVVI